MMTDFNTARHNMVESQLRANNVTDPVLIETISRIPREAFVPTARRAMSYCDNAVQVLSEDQGGPRYLLEPMTFGRLVQLAEITKQDMVLDIGCGTGYSAAVLGGLASSVVALEESESVAEKANNLLNDNGADNVAVLSGPLVKGYAQEAPYDVIVLEGAVEHVPADLFEQLKDGGRLVAIVQEGGVASARLFRKNGQSVFASAEFYASAPMLPGFKKPAEPFVY